MTIQCPSCGKQNPPESLWCLYCNTKIKPTLEFKEEEKETEAQKSQRQNEIQFSKKINMSSEKKIAAVLIPLIFFTPCVLIYLNTYSPIESRQIDISINSDFWFEEDTIHTYDGWVCRITKIQEYSLQGTILAMKTYTKYDTPYSPINIFSPMDVFIGIENIQQNPDRYPLEITSGNRVFYCEFLGESPQDELYVKEHVENNHIIPHNEAVLSTLQNLSVYDNVTINGSLVRIHAVRQNQHYHWNSDTSFGNSKCEIILTDSIDVHTEYT